MNLSSRLVYLLCARNFCARLSLICLFSGFPASGLVTNRSLTVNHRRNGCLPGVQLDLFHTDALSLHVQRSDQIFHPCVPPRAPWNPSSQFYFYFYQLSPSNPPILQSLRLCFVSPTLRLLLEKDAIFSRLRACAYLLNFLDVINLSGNYKTANDSQQTKHQTWILFISFCLSFRFNSFIPLTK